MSVLICGSIAYDTIMVFPDRFKQHILPDLQARIGIRQHSEPGFQRTRQRLSMNAGGQAILRGETGRQ